MNAKWKNSFNEYSIDFSEVIYNIVRCFATTEEGDNILKVNFLNLDRTPSILRKLVNYPFAEKWLFFIMKAMKNAGFTTEV